MDLSEHYRSWEHDDAQRMLFSFAMSRVDSATIEYLLDNMLMLARLGMIDRGEFAAVVAIISEHRPDSLSKRAVRFAQGWDAPDDE